MASSKQCEAGRRPNRHVFLTPTMQKLYARNVNWLCTSKTDTNAHQTRTIAGIWSPKRSSTTRSRILSSASFFFRQRSYQENVQKQKTFSFESPKTVKYQGSPPKNAKAAGGPIMFLTPTIQKLSARNVNWLCTSTKNAIVMLFRHVPSRALASNKRQQALGDCVLHNVFLISRKRSKTLSLPI